MAEQNDGERLIWFLAGVAVGATVGLLFAPKSGRETRQYLGEKTAEGRDFLAETGREAYDKVREFYQRGKSMAEAAAESFERGKAGETKTGA